MALATDNFHALLIGVGNYEFPEFPDLPVTVKDAEAMRDVLRNPDYCGYPGDNVHALLREQATLYNIRTHLKNLAHGSALAGTVIIYFSGHGGRDYSNGVWQAYLCPRGADARNLPGTAISASELSRALGAISAQRLVLILDMCFAGGAEMKSPLLRNTWKSGWSEDAYEALTRGSGRVIIASSEEDQVSRIRSDNDMSLFTYHLVDALRGKAARGEDGMVSVMSAYDYVSEAVQREVPAQKPVLKIPRLVGNFPLALAAGAKRPPETPLAPSEQSEQPAATTPPGQPSVGVGIGFQGGNNNTNYIAKYQRFDQRNTRSDT